MVIGIDELNFPNQNSIDELRTPDKFSAFDEFKTPLTADDMLHIYSSEAKKKRKEYFIEYFEVMECPVAEKQRRVKLAECLCDSFIETLIWLYTLHEADENVDISAMEERFRADYAEAIEEYLRSDFNGISKDASKELAPHIEKFATDVSGSTERNSEDIRFYSEGRAVLMASNESASAFGQQDFLDALRRGKTKKTWITARDERVRYYHADEDGHTIPIDGYFIVDSELMMYPKDSEHGATEHNLANCRCYVKYS